MIPEGTDPATVTEDLGKAVLAQVVAYKERTSRTITSIAKGIGYAPSTVSQVFSWKYGGDWRPIIVDLDRWLEEAIRRDEAPQPTQFVWTSVAREIKTVADAAVTLRTIGLVYGPTTSGIGKTMALEAIAAEKAGAIMITVEKVDANSSGLLLAICGALKIGGGGNSAHTYHRVKGVLRGTPRLLIIDQIHNLCGAKNDRPFFILADLFDATKAPQLWCGTSDIVAYLDRGQAHGKETLAQIRRRIGVRRDLMQRVRGGGDDGPGQPLYTVEEIRQVFGRNKMRLAPDGARYLLELANLVDCGALGSAANLVVMATAIHERGGGVLTATMLRSVHRQLISERSFTLLESQMSADQRTPALKVANA